MSQPPRMEREDGVEDPILGVRLRLYIARETPNSARAEENLKAALKQFDDDGYHLGLEIIDVFKTPRRAIADHVIATPTLIGLKASGTLTMMGDLTDTAKLHTMLRSLRDMGGDKPAAPQ